MKLAFLVIGIALIANALFSLWFTFSGGAEREMFDAGVSPLFLGLDWLFTFDISSISLSWYAGLACVFIGTVLVFRKERV